jgi:hypothetical protein
LLTAAVVGVLASVQEEISEYDKLLKNSCGVLAKHIQGKLMHASVLLLLFLFFSLCLSSAAPAASDLPLLVSFLLSQATRTRTGRPLRPTTLPRVCRCRRCSRT